MTVLFSSCDGAEPLARLGLRIGAADVGGRALEPAEGVAEWLLCVQREGETDPEDWLCVNGERVARFELLLDGLYEAVDDLCT
jgi:hypothetical protein